MDEFIQPKYKFGQDVVVELVAKYNSKIEIKEKRTGFISEIRCRGTSEKDSYEYGITNDLPGCYHAGEPPFMYIMEDDIVLPYDERMEVA